jgi:hypothetical protein
MPKCVHPAFETTRYDDAFFGCSFAHIFLKLHPEIVVGEEKEYVPRIFGIRVAGKRGSKYKENRFMRPIFY